MQVKEKMFLLLGKVSGEYLGSGIFGFIRLITREVPAYLHKNPCTDKIVGFLSAARTSVLT